MPDFNEVERRVLGALDGRERLKVLLRDRGLQMQDFARKHGLWVEQLSMCLRGERPYAEIRDALATELELSRETIDALIDGPTDDEPATADRGAA